MTLELALGEVGLSEEAHQQLAAAAEKVNLADEVRLVILRSRVRDFCRGGDAQSAVDGIAAIAAIRVPVIAVLQGRVLDEGLELALAADLRIASKATRLGMTQVIRGELPCHGGTQRLPRLIGRGTATRMLLFGETLTARQAEKHGLVTEVVDPAMLARRVRAVAQKVVSRGPLAQKLAKEALLAAGDLPLAEGLRLEGDLYVLSQDSEDRAEGLLSFREKRQPRYRGR